MQNDNQNQIQELQRQVKELMDWKTERMRQQITYPLDLQSNKVLGRDFLNKSTLDSNTLYSTLGYAIISSNAVVNGTSDTYKLALTTGKEGLSSNSGPYTTINTNVILQNSDLDTSKNSFLYGFRKPIYIPSGTITVTSAGNTLTDSNKNWATNELANAYVAIQDNTGAHSFTRQIASNTATVITIQGTWPSTVSGGTYTVFMPVQFGASEFPWRQIYAGGTDVTSGGTGAVRRAIRMGYGPSGNGNSTAGVDTIGIFYGTSSPESVVAANIGSLYLRLDGGATTTLYVKTSGTGNTGWTAK